MYMYMFRSWLLVRVPGVGGEPSQDAAQAGGGGGWLHSAGRQ